MHKSMLLFPGLSLELRNMLSISRFRNPLDGAQLLFIALHNIIIVLQSDHFLSYYNESSDSKASITALTDATCRQVPF